MRPEIERLIARAKAGSAPKIVDCQGGNANLGKSQREFLVKFMQPARIRIDENMCVTRMLRKSKIGVKAVAVLGYQHKVFSLRRASVARRCRWSSVVIVTHALCFLSIV